MALINLKEISISFGGNKILDKVSFNVQPQDKIALLGRNGQGKSTLMKIMNKTLSPDDGSVSVRKQCKISYLSQTIPAGIEGKVFDIIIEGFKEEKKLLSEFHSLTEKLSGTEDKKLIGQLDEVHKEIQTEGGWEIYKKVEDIIKKIKLSADEKFQNLSAGFKRRVMFAQCLVNDPDLLLLDEPTNHMDIESIEMMENILQPFPKAVIIITHDRTLVKKITGRILELDRGKIFDWKCDYNTFCKRKDKYLRAEERNWKVFDKKLAQEELWIRQGIKARRTRNEGRVKALLKLRADRSLRRERVGSVKMDINPAQQSGKMVIKAENIGFKYGNKNIINRFSARIERGDKIGIIGPNGCGKTTLIKLLLGELSGDCGFVEFGTKLDISYFDQLRDQLDPKKTVKENVVLGVGNEIISFNGRNRHVIGYLQDFLFTPQRADTKVKVLSGGEKNRLLLARLFSKPSNVLVLDEPTNDLDIDTLELLEELLLEYRGTIILVSHDRTFLNNIITSTLVFEGEGKVTEYLGGYDDWKIFCTPKNEKKEVKVREETKGRIKKSPNKFVYKEKQELESLPQRIEKLEEENEGWYKLMSDPDFFKSSPEKIKKTRIRMKEVEDELGDAYQRWEYLEEKKQNMRGKS